MKQIVHLMIKRTMKEVASQGYTMITSDEAKEKIAKDGFDPQYGARPLRRAIQKLIEDPLAEEFIRNKPTEGATIKVDLDEEKDELTFDIVEPEQKPETEEKADNSSPKKAKSKKAAPKSKDSESSKESKSKDK